ncbi:MAG: hypothetical protein LLG97_12900 [Deltaproteobacteria bacterium]|nr:hypothetical protein [Deltaproteobacteria bacterium]
METGTSLDARAGEAFIEALRRKAGLVFSEEEVVISERMNIGDSVVCTVEARKVNGESSQAVGKAYVYHDLVVVCIESVCRKWREPTFPHHYEYLSY